MDDQVYLVLVNAMTLNIRRTYLLNTSNNAFLINRWFVYLTLCEIR